MAAWTPAAAQQPAVPPAFEVVSIKRSAGDGRLGMQSRPDAIVLVNAPVALLFGNAWTRLPSDRILGLPDWVRAERYDITAKAAAPFTFEQRPEMLKALLADRFSLKVRTEIREVDAYALRVTRPDGQLGPQIRPASVDCLARSQARRPGEPAVPLPPGANGITPCVTQWNKGELRSGWTTIDGLAAMLANVTGRMVVDRTALDGNFELSMSHAEPDVPGDARPSLFTALQEQLGMWLESMRAPAEFLIVERIERPSAN